MASDQVYIGEATKIVGGMDTRTFRKYIKKGVFKVVSKDPIGHMLFSRKQIEKIAKAMRKDRKKGYPLIVSGK